MWYTIQHRTVLIIFPLILQTIITAQMSKIMTRRKISKQKSHKQQTAQTNVQIHKIVSNKVKDTIYNQKALRVRTHAVLLIPNPKLDL